MPDYSSKELMVIVLSRQIQDGWVGSPGGAASEIALAAIRLAQLTHAPNSSFISSNSGFIINQADKRIIQRLCPTSDYAHLFCGTEAIGDCSFVLSTRRDFFFSGALEVDSRGNLNLIGIGPYPRLTLRGPGTAGIGQASVLADHTFLYLGEHSRRTLVPTVSHISGLGEPVPSEVRRRLRVIGGGPRLVVTPLACLAFDESKTLRLHSIHPGHSLADVLAVTDPLFVPEELSRISQTPEPTRRELRLLRTRVDPAGDLCAESKRKATASKVWRDA